jgi:dolichol-phosphate mannosyltransferase
LLVCIIERVVLKEKILLFIPVYNCEDQICRVLAKLLPVQNYFSEILIIDNQSTDSSLEMAKRSLIELGMKKVKIILNTQNYSLGGSHKVAFQYAIDHGFDYLGVYHGDDQADIQDLIPLLEQKQHHKHACLLGSRFHKASKLVGYSSFRTYGNLILNLVCNAVCRARILDQGSGLNFYNVQFLRDRRIWGFPDNLTFNVYMLYHAFFSRASVHFFPISWREEDQVSNAKVFYQGWHILKLSFKTIVTRRKLYDSNSTPKQYSYQVAYES